MSGRPVIVVVAILFWMLESPHGSAQSDVEYLALLDTYARGDGAQAVASLSAWPEARVREVVRTLDTKVALARARTGVMLHTDAAFEQSADGREPFHVDVARSFLRQLTVRPRAGLHPPDEGGRDFATRWHALIGILYCLRDDDKRARLEINRGLALDLNHRNVNLVAGALVEHQASRAEPNLRGRRNAELGDLIARSLQRAANGYRVIVSNHPDFLEARLRLGWALTLNGAPQPAREQLEIVAARSMNADLRYLAHLFLGSIREGANHLGDAAREYEAARAVAPGQSSIIALIRTHAALGNDDRVRSLVEGMPATAGTDGNDPWHFYNGCFTGGELLEGRRREARR